MESGAKYSALDHGGLEVAPIGHVPEVHAPEAEDGSKEVVPGSGAPLERRKSNDAAEVMHPGQYEPQQSHPEEQSVSPYYAPDSKARPDGAEAAATVESGDAKAQRRYCGMKRGLFFIVIGVIIFIVILAAVLGGVLGTVLNKNPPANNINAGINNGGISNNSDFNVTSSASPPISALSNTGLATTVVASGTGRLLMYYQDDKGRIIENSNLDNTWTLQDSSNLDNSVVVAASTAQQGSPIGAIAYQQNGVNIRQVFFLDASGILHETNSSTVIAGIATSWSSPQVISSTIASTNCISIAACVNYAPMNGIRVYYGGYDPTNGGYVQEVGYDFTNKTWVEYTYLPEGDPNSGIACGVWNSTIGSSQYVNLYFRNSTTGILEQEYWDYSSNNGWSYGPTGPTQEPMMAGADIAVCDDQGDTEYIFWPLQNGTVVRGYLSPDKSSSNFSGWNLQAQNVSSGTKLAATWSGAGTTLLYQNSTNASTIWMAEVGRDNSVIANVAIT